MPKLTKEEYKSTFFNEDANINPNVLEAVVSIGYAAYTSGYHQGREDLFKEMK